MNSILFHLVAATVVVAILSSSTSFLVQPIFAFEIDQDKNEHRQSIKSTESSTVVSSTASLPSSTQGINQQDDESEEDEEEAIGTTYSDGRTTLQTDIFEFIDLIPVDEVNELKVRYYLSDPRVRQAFDYLQNYDYTFVQRDLCAMDEIKRAVAFVESRGMNLKEIGSAMYDRFGPPNNSIYATEGKSVIEINLNSCISSRSSAINKHGWLLRTF